MYDIRMESKLNPFLRLPCLCCHGSLLDVCPPTPRRGQHTTNHQRDALNPPLWWMLMEAHEVRLGYEKDSAKILSDAGRFPGRSNNLLSIRILCRKVGWGGVGTRHRSVLRLLFNYEARWFKASLGRIRREKCFIFIAIITITSAPGLN